MSGLDKIYESVATDKHGRVHYGSADYMYSTSGPSTRVRVFSLTVSSEGVL